MEEKIKAGIKGSELYEELKLQNAEFHTYPPMLFIQSLKEL